MPRRSTLSQQHARRMEKALAKQGTVRMNPIDPAEYPPIPGMEGPFNFRKGGVLYYDPRAGKYYDLKSDMYVDSRLAEKFMGTIGAGGKVTKPKKKRPGLVPVTKGAKDEVERQKKAREKKQKLAASLVLVGAPGEALAEAHHKPKTIPRPSVGVELIERQIVRAEKLARQFRWDSSEWQGALNTIRVLLRGGNKRGALGVVEKTLKLVRGQQEDADTFIVQLERIANMLGESLELVGPPGLAEAKEVTQAVVQKATSKMHRIVVKHLKQQRSDSAPNNPTPGVPYATSSGRLDSFTNEWVHGGRYGTNSLLYAGVKIGSNVGWPEGVGKRDRDEWARGYKIQKVIRDRIERDVTKALAPFIKKHGGFMLTKHGSHHTVIGWQRP